MPVDVKDINVPKARVLVLDDDPDYSMAIANNLELEGVGVDAVDTTGEAEYLLEKFSFQTVIVDIMLEGSPNMGDEFIIQNRHLLKRSDVVVVTGFPLSRIKRLSELEMLGVTVLQKGAGHLDAIGRIVSESKAKMTKEFVSAIHQYVSSLSTEPAPVNTRRLRVFLCHSSNDKPPVRILYRQLRDDGFDPWLDEERLLPGEEWDRKIPQAVRESDVVLVCISHGSINKKGYVQREIRLALDIADEQPEGTIFIIPLRLEACDVPERLRRWQWVDLFDSGGYPRLIRSLEAALAGYQEVASNTSLDLTDMRSSF